MSLAKAVPLTCTGHSRPVTHLMFSQMMEHDTRLYLLISACKDGQPMLRDGVSGDWIGTFIGHKGAIWCSKLTNDGSLAATASADFSAIIWDTTTGEVIATLPHDHIVRTCDFAPGSSKDNSSYKESEDFINPNEDLMLATAGHEGKIRIWNIRKKAVAMEWVASATATDITKKPPAIKTVMWVSKSLIISVDIDGLIQWWDISDMAAVEPKLLTWTKIDGEVGQVEYVNDWVITASGTFVNVIHGVTGKLIKQLDLGYKVLAVGLNLDHSKLVTGSSSDTYARLHDFDTGKLLDTAKGHHGPVNVVAFSPDNGKVVATGSEDGTIRLWKTVSGPYGLWNGS